MASFWLATFELNPRPLKSGRRRTPAGGWAIEVIGRRTSARSSCPPWTTPPKPSRLECLVGFANDCERCDLWRGRGFRLQDAEITLEDDILRVLGGRLPREPGDQLRVELVTIDRAMVLRLGRGQVRARKPTLDVTYSQSQVAPDFAAPATRVRQKPVSWKADRRGPPRAGSVRADDRSGDRPDCRAWRCSRRAPKSRQRSGPEPCDCPRGRPRGAQGPAQAAGPGPGQVRSFDRDDVLRRLRLPLRRGGGPRIPHRSRPPGHRGGRGDRRVSPIIVAASGSTTSSRR